MTNEITAALDTIMGVANVASTIPYAVHIARESKHVTHMDKRMFIVIDSDTVSSDIFWTMLTQGKSHKLDNLTAVLDYNRSQDNLLNPENIRQIAMFAGWAAVCLTIRDERDTVRITDAFDWAETLSVPSLIIAIRED